MNDAQLSEAGAGGNQDVQNNTGHQHEISHHSTEVAKGSFWSFAGNIFFKLVSFIYVIIIARIASQDDVGLFSLCLSIMTVVMVFSDLGLTSSLQRYVPYYEGSNKKGKITALFKSTYLIVLFSSIIFMVAIWFSADTIGSIYHNPKLPDAMRMMVSFILIYNILRIHSIYLQGRTDIKSMQLISNLQNIFKLVLAVVFFYFYGASIVTIIASYVISFLIADLISVPYVYRNTLDLKGQVEDPIPAGEFVKEVMPFGFMLSVLSSFLVAISSADRILLGYLTISADALKLVAIYSYAANLAFVLAILPSSIETIFLPIVSRIIGKNDMNAVRSTTATAQRWTLLVTIPTAIVMILFSGEILGAFYGDAYTPGALVMSIITLAVLVRTYASMLTNTLAAMRLVNLELKIYAIVAISNILLNLLLIPEYGMIGSAIATLASFVLLSALFYYYSKKSFGYTIQPEIYRITGAGIAAFVLVFLIHSALPPAILVLPSLGAGDFQSYASKFVYLAYLSILMLISTVVFGFSCLWLKCIHREDISLLKKVLHKMRMPQQLVEFTLKITSLGLSN